MIKEGDDILIVSSSSLVYYDKMIEMFIPR